MTNPTPTLQDAIAYASKMAKAHALVGKVIKELEAAGRQEEADAIHLLVAVKAAAPADAAAVWGDVEGIWVGERTGK